MLRSRLFQKAFSAIFIGILLYGGMLYLSSVPWISQTVERQEEETGRLVLNNIYELAQVAYYDISSWRESALESRRRELRNIVSIVEKSIDRLEQEIREQTSDAETIRQKILDAVRTLNYGHSDYVFIADYDSFLISHPDDRLHGSDYSAVTDLRGNTVVPPMVAGAQRDGEGFHSYWWHRLGEEKPTEKLSYYRHLPQWEWVIGTGVYVDDVEAEVDNRLDAAIERLRTHLSTTRIANTGYLYVFDSDLNMLIHPNPNIDGTNFSSQLNTVTGYSIGRELIEAEQTPEQKLYYKWDKPDDPGRYVYEKISWIRYMPELDWYIASSVYVEELQSSARQVTSRMIVIGSVVLALALMTGYFYLRNLLVPILRLTEAAAQVENGDLTARVELNQNDEIGLLAKNFNGMVERLKEQIDTMEKRIAERTAELALSVRTLEKRNRESAEINRMGEMLQACQTEKEIFSVAASTSMELFPEVSGRIYLSGDGGSQFLAIEWGAVALMQSMDDSVSCRAIRCGKPHYHGKLQTDPLCDHCHQDGSVASLCVPLLIEGTIGGVIKLVAGSAFDSDKDRLSRSESLLLTVAENVGLSVTNLRLRQRLHEQSIRDSLTGLYNRRYLDDLLERELARAQRNGCRLGVLMLDIDRFKEVNDIHGHQVGDAVLREIGKLLNNSIRRGDFACRYGGEEFVLIVPDAETESLVDLAELIRNRVEQGIAGILAIDGLDQITLSAGIALSAQQDTDVQVLLKDADTALYRAKMSGRNRVAVGAEFFGGDAI